MTAESVSAFLLKGEGLNKTAIGNYLGERCMLLVNGVEYWWLLVLVLVLILIVECWWLWCCC